MLQFCSILRGLLASLQRPAGMEPRWKWATHGLPELLGQRDDDALWSTDVGQPVRVAVLHFADELSAVGAHARHERIDVIDGEHDPTDAERVERRIDWSKSDRLGRVELVQLNALPIGSPQHRKGGPDILQPDQFPDRSPLDSL